ncbi:ATP-binding protein [Spirosoma rhododendri]|uniref:histidine kinase n=1 Tax=Spirosoma rhododendri TaxID=2728024 RepID=A0A7L5DN82_9BACT|nr:ATP-binding protein [Spirosoma rhododendri]QJD77210.1 response regulator [Spirosoma rhododendri]
MAAATPTAQRGVLDLRGIDVDRRKIILDGQWKWYWHQLRTPGQPESSFEYIAFPKLWSASEWRGKPVSSQGYATYALTVLLPPHEERMGLELGTQYTAYKLFVNGEEITEDGQPGTTPATTTPYWSTQLVMLPEADTLQILFQIANFDHSKGGPNEAPRLGGVNALRGQRYTALALDILLTGCLFMSGLFFLGLFSFNRYDRSMLYFGLFCLLYNYRVIGVDTYALHVLFPNIPWLVTTRLEYGSLYLSIAAFGLYTQALYPKDTHKWFVRAVYGLCLLFTATLALPSLVFTRFMPFFLVLSVLCIAYVVYVYWLAARRARPGATYSLMSTVVLMVVFSMLLGNYLHVLNAPRLLLTAGYMTFFFFQSLVLSYRFGFIINEARRTEKQFLANMSHEIRTPLNAILGFSSMLETTPLDKEQQEAVGFIRSAGRNLLTIVNDILDISKIEAGMLSLELIPFSLSGLVDSLRTMMNPVACEKGLQLIVETDPMLPNVVQGDPTRLTQILLNLLSNAIKFTKQGRVTVTMQLASETDDTIQVRIVVQDTGIGIDSDALQHIFERFRQASDFTTRYYGGTGLGLNIVRSLIEMQGGWIKADSKPGEGSRFTLEIPYQKTDEKVASADWSEAVQLADAEPLTILIAEDNMMNQKLAVQVLKRLGHVGVVAENGQRAIELLQQQPFDLVLMDIQMPVLDGYTTTQHIRSVLHSQVPIIAMTAHALASERERCLQAGMNDFLPKPFQINELQRIIRKYAPSSVQSAPVITQPMAIAHNQPTNFSFDYLVQSLDDDLPFAIELLDLFLMQTPGEIDQIRQALAQGDVSTIKYVLHAQKGPIQTLGLTKTVAENKAIEAILTSDKPTIDQALVEQYLCTLEAELAVIKTSVAEKRNHIVTE